MAATLLSMLLVLGALGSVGYVVSQQMLSLADQIAKPKLRQNLRSKITFLKPESSAIDKLAGVASEMAETLDTPVVPTDIQEAKRLAPGEVPHAEPATEPATSTPRG